MGQDILLKTTFGFLRLKVNKEHTDFKILME